jgi:hypothetical protein
MGPLSRRDCTFVCCGLVVGLAIAAFAFSVGWTYGSCVGEQRQLKLEQDWWGYSAKVDVISRWEEHHLPPDDK